MNTVERASSDANAYALKKKMQMEKAAALRAERKASGGTIKNAASDMLSVEKQGRS
jgi:hypothetical protein